MSDAVDELAHLRRLLAEALSDVPDGQASSGAVELRKQFAEASRSRERKREQSTPHEYEIIGGE